MNILSQWLARRGIDKVEDLSPEEKATFDQYKLTLSGEAITVETIKDFCTQQIRIIETKFSEGITNNDTYFKACLHVYLNLLKLIEAEKAERERLEKHLNDIINEKV